MARATISSLNAHKSSSKTPACHDDHVDARVTVQHRNPLGDLPCGSIPLDANRIDTDVKIGETPAQNLQYVSNHRAGWRGDDPETTGALGSGRLREPSNNPSCARRTFNCSKAICNAPTPLGSM